MCLFMELFVLSNPVVQCHLAIAIDYNLRLRIPTQISRMATWMDNDEIQRPILVPLAALHHPSFQQDNVCLHIGISLDEWVSLS